MLSKIIWLCLAIIPPERDTPIHFDRIEVNHYYYESGKKVKVIDQVLFMDWVPERRQFIVQAWMLLKDSRIHTPENTKKWERLMGKKYAYKGTYPGEFVKDERFPILDRGLYRGTYKIEGRYREVVADTFGRVHSGYDREVENRKQFHETQRLGFEKDVSH